MKPVICLVAAKGFSMLQAFVSRDKPLGKAIRIAHSKDGYETLEGIIAELKDRTGEEIFVIMEATGYYHRGIQAHFGFSQNAVLILTASGTSVS
ncbi:IS110 family transposase [Paenibacillus xylanexedens]|uniref:IS110 family transposase n=1 Tax=Paenibacillus xylanexedens TaxID=528191 RepID=UPI00119E9F97|nr:IS110 family transposase [Paenibacillus xylanexedens]